MSRLKTLRKLGILATIICLMASVTITPTISSAAGSLIPDDNLRKEINEQLEDDGVTGIDVDTHQPTEEELESLRELWVFDRDAFIG